MPVLPDRAAATRPERRRFRSWLGRLFVPGSQCLICRQWQGDPLCPDCLAAFARPQPRCRACAIGLPGAAGEFCPDCLRAPPPCSRTVAALDYAHPWDGLLLRLKFGGRPELARPLAALLASAVEHAMQSEALLRPDLLLPVPVSDARLRERGHNQAWQLARQVARRLQLPAHADLLWRVRDTPHQLALPKAERQSNVHGAFACHPAARRRLEGRCVALLDDVMTTGATTAEASRTLLRAGAADVQVWVVARTP